MREGALAGRRILITGAASGIGRATAEACGEAGALVACLGRRRNTLEPLAGSVGGVAVVADIRDPAQVGRAVAVASDALGGLDGLVNSAGTARLGSLQSTEAEDWRVMFETNVIGLLVVTKAALPHLQQVAGVTDVVNVSSMSGRRVRGVDFGIYGGTKFAVHAVSESLRREVHGTGVRVTVVAPGAVDTAFGGATPGSGRVALHPDDVARQIVWAMSQPEDVVIHEIAMTSVRQPPA